MPVVSNNCQLVPVVFDDCQLMTVVCGDCQQVPVVCVDNHWCLFKKKKNSYNVDGHKCLVLYALCGSQVLLVYVDRVTCTFCMC